MPVYTVVLERAVVDEPGPWVAALGPDPKGWVRLRRRADVGDRFSCFGEIRLPASRFGRLMRFSERRLNDVNLKALLESEFAAPTVEATGRAWTRRLAVGDARVLGLPQGSWGMEVHIVTFGVGRQPLTFQRMVVPPTEYALRLDFVGPSAATDDRDGAPR